MAVEEQQSIKWLSERQIHAFIVGGGATIVVAALVATLGLEKDWGLLVDALGGYSIVIILGLVVLTALLRWGVERWAGPGSPAVFQVTRLTLIRILLLLAVLAAQAVLAAVWLIAAVAGSGWGQPVLDALVLVLIGSIVYVALPLKIMDNCLLTVRILTRAPGRR